MAELESVARTLQRKLERSRINLARLEGQRDRGRAYLQTVIGQMRETQLELKLQNAALECARVELEMSRRQALRANAAKSTFLANMSHELRTPLNAVIGYGELILEDERARHLIEPDMSHILAAGSHLLGLIDAILDLSKIEAGHDELSMRPLDLGAVLDNVVATIQPLADAGQIRFEQDRGALPQKVVGDGTRLVQVLTNLLANAVKFTADGSVHLGVIYRDGRCCFTVVDTGIGMARGQLDSVFQPFVQADSSTTRRFGGTGLGLSICRRIVELWGGTIEVSSTLGVGSRFDVTLPMPLAPVPGPHVA